MSERTSQCHITTRIPQKNRDIASVMEQDHSLAIGLHFKEQPIQKLAKHGIVMRQRIKSMLRKLLFNLMDLVIFHKVDDSRIQQEWEKGQDNDDFRREKTSFLFVKLSKTYFFVQLFMFLFSCLTIWTFSVHSAFTIPAETMSITVIICFVMMFLSILVQINTARLEQGREVKNRKRILIMYMKGEMPIDILCVACYIILDISQESTVSEIATILLIICLLLKTRHQYQNLRPFIDHHLDSEHITLITSFGFLLTMGHLFAIFFYVVGSRLNQDRTWLRRVQIQSSSWDIRYIYSFYWAVTTMVTVGYGDISPQNKYQVIATIIVEILGTSIFGYMINIIGMTLSEMKKRDEALEKQLRIADKISKSFTVRHDLTFKLKNFLRNNHKADSSFSLVDQNNLIDKLNPVLRQQLLQETHSKVIKKSIFLLTQFSKTLQNKICLKLKKIIFQPCEPLLQIFGDQSIYIVDDGQVDINILKWNKTRVYSKKVRSIAAHRNKFANSNVYGYTAMVTGRRVNISATSSTFTVAYELKKSDLHEAIVNQIHDHEALHELKDRFLATERLETIEAPQLKNPRQHFYPHRYLLIKKNRKQNKQQRKYLVRHERKEQSRYKSIKTEEDPTDEFGPHHNTFHTILQVVIKETLEQKQQFECPKTFYKYMKMSNVANVCQKYNRIIRQKNKGERRKSNFTYC